MVVGLLHPGEMGAAVGAQLAAGGRHDVLWASEGRSEATARRAAGAGLVDAGTVAEIVRRTDVVLSICPPHAALDMAARADGFNGIYVDANAVSPPTAREVGARVATFVDGGIIGPPPQAPGDTRLYLSGERAGVVADLFANVPSVAAIVLDGPPGTASALKMAYASWTKGTEALLLAARASARAEGVEEALLHEWETSIPGLADRSASAGRSAVTKGWRWVAEMEEIAATFAAAGLPSGFHEAAAEIFRRSPREEPDAETIERVLSALLGAGRVEV
jgi:3-hydroxyisobutyrate dehydrogenase-like beta-hydroxyacid dehydrogenase